eukprot:3318966-Pleurochrysis_carterae.AAC.1
MLPIRPMSWYCGTQLTTHTRSCAQSIFQSRCISLEPQRQTAHTFARTCDSPTMTPFGWPVEPEVNCRKAGTRVRSGALRASICSASHRRSSAERPTERTLSLAYVGSCGHWSLPRSNTETRALARK